MKKYIFIFLCLFPMLGIFAVENPAILEIKKINIEKGSFILEDGSRWTGFPSYGLKAWKSGNEIVICDHPEYGFTAFNLTLGIRLSVEIVGAPETHVVEIGNNHFLLSNDLILERSSYMALDIGDQIYLCGYSIGREASSVIIYNCTKPWIGGRTQILE